MKTQTLRSNQQGFAALIIAFTLVIIVSLITVGFAQLMRNELNQTTNRQLADQAYYAAESGVNDAQQAIVAGHYDQKKTTCAPLAVGDPSPGAEFLENANVGTNAQWTCLLINPAPGNLEYGDVDTVNMTSFIANATDASGNAK